MKKFLIIFLFFGAVLIFPKSVFADLGHSDSTTNPLQGRDQSTQDLQGLETFNPTVDSLNISGDSALDNYAARLFGFILNSGARNIVGGGGGSGAQQTVNKGGAIQFFANSIGGMYEAPPASTYAYINYVAHNAGFDSPIKPVYAATGIGFSALDPVMKIWQVMRNLAYLALSVVFVVVGLMIILRVKIDPKTVISIQNALPKMILSMILITFSYPIAGFMVDLMYVLIGVVMGIAGSTGLLAGTSLSDFQNGLQNQTIFGFVGMKNWWSMSTGAAVAISSAVSQLTDIFGVGGTNIAGVAAGALGGLIIAVAILYALFKTWLSLLGAYVNILVGTIFSPFAMLGEAIPGMSSFSVWLRSMAAALLSFPTVVMMLVFGKAIMEYGQNFNTAGTSGGAFVPPLIGGNNPSAVTSLIGLGILLMIPKAVEMMSTFLKAPPFKFGNAWQESTGWAWNKSPLATARGAAYDYGRGKVFSRVQRDRANDAAWEDARAKYAAGVGPDPGPRNPAAKEAGWGLSILDRFVPGGKH